MLRTIGTRRPRQRHPLLWPDHMDDTLLDVVEQEEGDTKDSGIGRPRFHLQSALRIGDAGSSPLVCTLWSGTAKARFGPHAARHAVRSPSTGRALVTSCMRQLSIQRRSMSSEREATTYAAQIEPTRMRGQWPSSDGEETARAPDGHATTAHVLRGSA